MKIDKKNEDPKTLFSFLFSHKGSIFVALTAVLLNIGIWFFMFFKRQPDDYPLPLHYDVYGGVDTIDVWSKLYYLPILGIVIILINYAISALIADKDVMIAYFLNIASVLIQVILFVALFWIVYLQNDLFQL